LDALPFKGEDEDGGRRGVRQVLEGGVEAEVVGAVGVVAAGTLEAEVDVARENDLGRRVVALNLRVDGVRERFAEDDLAVERDLEVVRP